MQPLKDLENLCGILLIKTNTIIRYNDLVKLFMKIILRNGVPCLLPSYTFCCNSDMRIYFSAFKLDSIAEEILKLLPQLNLICMKYR